MNIWVLVNVIVYNRHWKCEPNTQYIQISHTHCSTNRGEPQRNFGGWVPGARLIEDILL